MLIDCLQTTLIKRSLINWKYYFDWRCVSVCFCVCVDADSPERPSLSAGTRLWLRWSVVSVHLTGWYPATEGRKTCEEHFTMSVLHPYMRVALIPRVANEITVYFLHYFCMKKSNMTVLCLNKVIPALYTLTSIPLCTVMIVQYSEPQWELWPCLENNKTTEKFKENGQFYCGTDPLPNLCLVPLWKDVNVRLKRTGLNDSLVSAGHKQRQNTDEDREQLLILAGRKLRACLLLTLSQLSRYHSFDWCICMHASHKLLKSLKRTMNTENQKRKRGSAAFVVWLEGLCPECLIKLA